MLISNRKTREEFEVTSDTWQRMKEIQKDHLFKVLDKSNVPAAKKVVVPDNIVEFQATVPKKIIPQNGVLQITETVIKHKKKNSKT